jgi:DHA2 family multidrug resistance protein
MDARKLLAFGSVLFIVGTYGLGFLTTLSGEDDFYWPLIWRGLSLGFLFIPLTVASLADLDSRDMGTGSGLINLTRQLGGSMGIALFSTLITRRLAFHEVMIRAHLTDANPVIRSWIAGAQATLTAAGQSPNTAHAAALQDLSLMATQQALMLAFDDAFLMIALVFLLAMPLILLIRKSAKAGVVPLG